MLTEKNKEVIRQFAANDMRTTETAYALNYHRNSVIYHLKQVKQQTRLDPQKFYDLIQLLGLIEDNATKKGEVVEVAHGRWEESKCFDDCFWVCSNCRFPSEATAAPILYHYCPNCGARMDGET